ncbi:conjugative transfer domain protein [Orientia tsutsugamushi str. UT76]|uniref:Conjugative transfer protein n=2 Tax=Orientia tsutsugamushi TaxID=784 RepID=A0A2R8F373_ORITS|nr:conjugative transfer domain protein [Orientia tsutsugamushi str. UT76]KJV87479.1 conjugative transfer domain protein [Orientia tsutsugamushi str. UT76]SPM45885.1 conjugative transfer protein [Orientia tsutsugamushi]SPR03663.1 conjugative transfer protein [Orientia tsutsugamushi]
MFICNLLKAQMCLQSFFLKKVEVINDGVLISATLCYWFSNSKHIAIDKTYFLTYKRSPNYLLLLSGVNKKKNWLKMLVFTLKT